MKILRSVLAILVISAMAVTLGCSKKDSPTTPTTTPPAGTTATASNLSGATLGAINFASGFSSGLSGYVPAAPSKKSPPDTLIWIGPVDHANHYNSPANSGWYYWTISDTGIYQTKVWVKFTPDWWQSPTTPPTRVDMGVNMTITLPQSSSSTEFAAYMEQADPTHYNGKFWIGTTASATTVSWEFIYSNISSTGWDSTPRTCSGSFSYSGYGGWSGSYTFANGSGTGDAAYGGVNYIHFVFNADGTGYYTISGSSTQHPFTW
ncbi:MAG: hypothetical protein QME74_06965 [Candidatus Edwardsbacteria bacterium]|nr:hypothetical protein [Candidatus Edwardsbacteria bacterium]